MLSKLLDRFFPLWPVHSGGSLRALVKILWPPKTLTINSEPINAGKNATILQAAEEAGVKIPTLCHLDGIYGVGACRLCLVEVAGVTRLLPACTAKIAEGMDIPTDSDRLQKYRRMTLELFFARRNRVCAVCMAHGHCEPPTLAYSQGMDHSRCILCTRCVRICSQSFLGGFQPENVQLPQGEV